jgi:hypothetical protein
VCLLLAWSEKVEYDEDPTLPMLEVFEQGGAWTWALTVARQKGVGVRVLAYSEGTFETRSDAHSAGENVKKTFSADNRFCQDLSPHAVNRETETRWTTWVLADEA